MYSKEKNEGSYCILNNNRKLEPRSINRLRPCDVRACSCTRFDLDSARERKMTAPRTRHPFSSTIQSFLQIRMRSEERRGEKKKQPATQSRHDNIGGSWYPVELEPCPSPVLTSTSLPSRCRPIPPSSVSSSSSSTSLTSAFANFNLLGCSISYKLVGLPDRR